MDWFGSRIDYHSNSVGWIRGFQDDEDRFRFCIRYVVRKYGKSDGTELCKRYNSRRQPIRSLRDCLSAVYVPAGDYRSSAVNVLVKLRIEN